jgi:prolipoprotein diacylglyceryltransferase
MTNVVTNAFVSTNDPNVAYSGVVRVPSVLIELLLVALALFGLWFYFNKKNINQN